MPENIEAVGLEFDTRAFEDAIRRAERRLDDLEDRVDASGKSARKAESDFVRWGQAVLGVAAAYGTFRVAQDAARFIFDTNVAFEQLEARLTSIEGSAEAALSAFGMITDFARETPFEVENLVEAFTVLRAAGIQPTMGMMRDLGNFSAAMGRDITEAVQAILRAAQGGTERLRESFFIPIEKDGDHLRITWRGQTQEIAATTEDLIGYFQRLSQQDFGDGMSRQMDTMAGSISNLKDSSAILAREIGRAGLTGEINDLVRVLDDAIADGNEFADVIGGALAAGVDVGTDALEAFVLHIDVVQEGLLIVTGAGVAAGLAGLTQGLMRSAKAAAALGAATTFLGGWPGLIVAAGGALGLLIPKLLEAETAAEKTAAAMGAIAAPEMDISGLERALAQVDQRIAEEEVRAGRAGRAARSARDGGATTLEQNFRRMFRQAIEEKGRLQALRDEIVARMGELASGGSDATSPADVSGPGDAALKEFTKLTQRLEGQRIELQQGARAAFEYELSISELTSTQQAEVLALWDSVQALEALAEVEEEARKTTERRDGALRASLDGLREQYLAAVLGEEGLLRMSLAAQGASDSQIELAVAMHRGTQAFQEQHEDLAKLQAEAQHLKTVGDRLAQDLTDPLFDFIDGTKSGAEAFSDMVDSILQDLVRLTIQKSLTDTLSSALAGAIGDALHPIPATPAPIPLPDVDVSAPSLGLVGGRGAQQVVHQTVNLQVSAMDGHDASRVLRREAGTIVEVLGEAVRSSEGARQMILGG